MKDHILQSIVIVLAMVGLCMAESNLSPHFDDYPVTNIYKGKPKPVNLQSHPNARKWRTMLREGAKEGPNFAGHYTIAKWGCGSSCVQFGIIDATTGNVYFPKGLTYVSWGWWWKEDYGLKFTKDSRLLVVYGSPNDLEDHGVFYYLWEGDDLKLIKSYIEK